MTSFSIGRQAEDAAATYLANEGYRIIEQNWRTKWCEIDLVTKRGIVIYFVEVKYRANSISGSGLEYITARKLSQMTRAAESWVQRHSWAGDYELAAIAVSGKEFAVTDLVTI